jgi:hypothetical protein
MQIIICLSSDSKELQQLLQLAAACALTPVAHGDTRLSHDSQETS